jgi:beta-glucosidase
MRGTFALLSLLPAVVLADVITRIPDAAPPGFEEWISPIVVPAKNVTGDDGWSSAVQRARAFVAQLTLEEKVCPVAFLITFFFSRGRSLRCPLQVNVTTGADIYTRCVGNTGTIPRLGWNGLCLEDSPLGVRFADYVSALYVPLLYSPLHMLIIP